MNLIRKALWPTAIGAAVLMLFGALGSAVNADSVNGNVQTEDGGVVYVEVELAPGSLAALTAASADAEAAVKAARALVAAALVPPNRISATIVTAATALRDAANEVAAVITDINTAIVADNTANAAAIAADEARNAIVPIEAQTDGITVVIPPAATAADSAQTEALALDSTALGATVTAMTNGLALLPSLGDATHDYTVEIDDGSGSASIVETLRSGDGGADGGDANVASNRATDSRTVTPVEVENNADRDELKDYGVDAEVGESYVLVVVECTEFGSYTISFTHGTDGDEEEADLECVTDVDSAVLSASASTIFTTTTKLTSTVTVTLENADGDAATPGDNVRFKTDNCEFETTSKTTRDVDSTTAKGVTTAVVTLKCSMANVGTATVSASVDRAGGSDVYAEGIVITVVGSAAALTLSVSMDDMDCGDVRTIDITGVVDKNGVTVAKGTGVIVSTNFGGVLTGETTGRFAPSSTAVSTNADGAARVYLITSDTQVGDYAVVASAGSGVDDITVSCGMMEAADADADAPSITPPNTGDAGLVETSGSSWMLLAIAGALASVMIALGKGMPLFFRRS